MRNLSLLRIFVNDDVSSKVDATIFWEYFNLVKNVNNPNLLFCKRSACGLIMNTHWTKRNVCFLTLFIFKVCMCKHRYEMYRFYCSSSRTSAQTDTDLLCLLRENESSLPIKAWACVIMRDIDKYLIFYWKFNCRQHIFTFSCIKYSPWKGGDQFKMPTICVEKFLSLKIWYMLRCWW